MIHCKKNSVGCQVQIEGPANGVVKEALYIIQGVYNAFASDDKQEAEKYKKLMISAVLGLDGFCIFDAPSDLVRVDLSALHDINRNGGDIDGRSEEMPR